MSTYYSELTKRASLQRDGFASIFPQLGPFADLDEASENIAWTAFSPGESISIGLGTNADHSYIVHNLNAGGISTEDQKKWIAGHLVSHSFHGEGSGYNIVPLTRSANSVHETEVEEHVVDNQRPIAVYFRQQAVRKYTRYLLSLRYTVWARGKANGIPSYLECRISYFYAERDDGWGTEDTGWKTTEIDDHGTKKVIVDWKDDLPADRLWSMVNDNCDYMNEFYKLWPKVRHLGEIKDEGTFIKNDYNAEFKHFDIWK